MGKKFFITIALLAGISLASTLFAQASVDVSSRNLEQGNVALDGNWLFYWQKFVQPEGGSAKDGTPLAIDFNTEWHNLPQKRFATHAKGYGSYVLNLYSAERREDLALFIPEFYSSYRMFLNGKELSQNGNPSNVAEQTTPFWLPKAVAIELHEGDNRLVIHAANFHHHRGGPVNYIELGERDKIFAERNLSTSGALLIYGALVISAIFSLTLFYFYRKDFSFLFYGLFALVYSYRVIGSDTYVLHEFLPNVSWFVTIRLEYFSLYVSVILFTYFYKHLIKQRAPGWMFHTVAGVSLFMIITVLLSVETFTMLFDYYMYFLLVAGVVITAVYLIKMRLRHIMAWMTAVSVAALMAVFVFKSLEHFNVLDNWHLTTFICYLIFIVFQAIALSQKFGYDLRKQYSKVADAKTTQRHFLNSVSHELRTPMNAILGMTNFLENTDLSKEQQNKLKTIKDNSENLNTLLLDLLNFSAIDSGEIRLDYKRMNLKETLDHYTGKVKDKYRGKGLKFNLSYENQIPDDLVGDDERIGLVITHLLDNAFKYTKEGSVQMRVSIIDEDKNRLKLRIKIVDSGKGISKQELDKVLEAFYQGEQGDTRGYGGTGLGLTLSARIVELMGGDLWIDSKPGEGTAVELEFDMRRPRLDLSEEKEGIQNDLNQLDKSLKILYAEDNPINQKLLKMMMKSLGFDIDIAENGLEAWEMALTKSYNIIFMDVQMPKMDGIEASRRIISDIPNRPIIIAVTANADAADRQKCAEAGMNDFISKPFNAASLKEGLTKWQGLSKYLDSDNNKDVLEVSP